MHGCGAGRTPPGVQMSKRKRPIVLEPDPGIYRTRIPVSGCHRSRSLSEAVRAAAKAQGLDLPRTSLKPLGRFYGTVVPEYGLTVRSRIRKRESLQVAAYWNQRGWRIDGCHADHRMAGSAWDLAEVARVAHVWRTGTALADIHHIAPDVTLHPVTYRYFGIIRPEDVHGEPSTVLRTWTDARGSEREETFMASLDWVETDTMSPTARPTYDPDPVEIDSATVGRFIYRITDHVTAEQRRR